MEVGELAAQLKDRLIETTDTTLDDLDGLTDGQIIDSYIKCSCCGEKSINSVQLIEVIEEANNDTEFLKIIILKSNLNKN